MKTTWYSKLHALIDVPPTHTRLSVIPMGNSPPRVQACNMHNNLSCWYFCSLLGILHQNLILVQWLRIMPQSCDWNLESYSLGTRACAFVLCLEKLAVENNVDHAP